MSSNEQLNMLFSEDSPVTTGAAHASPEWENEASASSSSADIIINTGRNLSSVKNSSTLRPTAPVFAPRVQGYGVGTDALNTMSYHEAAAVGVSAAQEWFGNVPSYGYPIQPHPDYAGPHYSLTPFIQPTLSSEQLRSPLLHPRTHNVAPSRGRRMYVGNLDYFATAKDVKEWMLKHGTGHVIEAIFLPRDASNGDRSRSRGYCFVTLIAPGLMDEMITLLDNQTLHGRHIHVRESYRSRRYNSYPSSQAVDTDGSSDLGGTYGQNNSMGAVSPANYSPNRSAKYSANNSTQDTVNTADGPAHSGGDGGDRKEKGKAKAKEGGTTENNSNARARAPGGYTSGRHSAPATAPSFDNPGCGSDGHATPAYHNAASPDSPVHGELANLGGVSSKKRLTSPSRST